MNGCKVPVEITQKIISEVELLYGIEAIAFYMMSHVSDEAREVYTKNNIITYVGNVLQKRWNILY